MENTMEKEIKPTKETQYLHSNCTGEVYLGIEYIISKYPSWIPKPSKPILTAKHTSEDVLKYADQVKEYEKQLSEYKIHSKNTQLEINRLNNILEEFIKEEAGLNSIPEQYRSKVWSKAWSDGHSSGYYEVYGCLCSLISIFE